MSDQYLIAYDIGTSGTKASLYSADGRMLHRCTVGYEISYRSGGRVEQYPDDWWNAVVTATRKLTENADGLAVAAVSFSGQMMGCLLIDRDGKPLGNSIIWADTRAQDEAEILSKRVGEERGYQILGHRISCSYSIEKLMWLKKNEPERYEQGFKMIQAKDYIILKMTGRVVSDYSDGSGTNGMDLLNNCWSREVLDAAGLDMDKMPELVQSAEVVGHLTKEAASLLHLSEDVKVVAGGGDGPCATLGSGCVRNGQYYLTFGTSAWVSGTSAQPRADEKHILFTFSHVIPGMYSPTGTMQAAGSSYAYMKRTFCQEEIQRAEQEKRNVYDILDEMIEKIPAGSDHLLYLPYLNGERAPRWNPNASGAFLGMTMEHTKAHYLRAALEGVAMNLDLILRAHREHEEINRLILTGGGAKGDIVARILADVTGCEMVRPDHVEDATSMAAAVLAGFGAGIYQNFDAINLYLKFGQPIRPDEQNHKIYQKLEKVFDDVYYALEPCFKEIQGK